MRAIRQLRFPSPLGLPRCPAPCSSERGVIETRLSRSLFASLRARTLELEESVAKRWVGADCQSQVCLALNDWVRRLAVDWPRAFVGSASGSLHLCDLTNGETLCRVDGAHPGRGGIL